MLNAREELKQRLAAAAQACAGPAANIGSARARQPEHGAYSTNLAMTLAKAAKCAPRALAEKIVAAFDSGDLFAVPEIAGPGFINFRLTEAALQGLAREIVDAGGNYGRTDAGRGRKVLVEFVSANPTGPLHIGTGRNAAYGDAVARLLAATGYAVTREYYLNDTGNQTKLLGESLWVRYRQAQGQAAQLPEEGYQGEYLKEIAQRAVRDLGAGYEKLDEQTNEIFSEYACKVILEEITGDLKKFGVTFDRWQSEKQLYADGEVDKAVARLQQAGALEEKDGALWLKSDLHGDEKPRVVRREDRRYTYLASDIAYHAQKFARGFDRCIDVWGYDHHGYEGRIRAALRFLALDDSALAIRFYQLVNLMENGQKVAMGKRSGSFVTLRQVTDEVSTDVARWFFLMRSHDSHLDFDLALAKQQSNDNPVYYVQYAHARIASICRQEAAAALGEATPADCALLTDPAERALLLALLRFPDEVADAAAALEPQRLTVYLHDLTGAYHQFYDRCRVLGDDAALSRARLLLCRAAQQTIANGLSLLGISAPSQM